AQLEEEPKEREMEVTTLATTSDNNVEVQEPIPNQEIESTS
ncbi:22966_t:CDS:1, partial [Gigaspora rosea]